MSEPSAYSGPPIICVVGPTASGKSSLAIRLACFFDGEVLSADSMQIYKGMDIGTGKVSKDEQIVPHHGLDLISPNEAYSAALFQAYARHCFADIAQRNKRCILAGGTGFYVRAALDDYHFPAGEQCDNPLRQKYQDFAKTQGIDALWDLLKQADPQSAQCIPPKDVKRVIRALELLDQEKSYAQQKEKLKALPQLIPAHFIGLAVEPALLNERIDRRVDAMFEQGLVAEVEGLLNSGFREGITAPSAIGYKEVVAALDGQISLEEAKERIKIATHRYAKRQRTWFRKDKRITWLDANDADIEALAKRAELVIMKAES